MSLIYPAGDQQVTPKLLLATWGMDEELANNMILIDNAFAGIAGPGGSNGDIQYNNAGSFGGSAATITAAGSMVIPDGQTISDPVGNQLIFFSTVIGLEAVDGSLVFAGSGAAGLGDPAGDFIEVAGTPGGYNWEISNAAGSCQIRNPFGTTEIDITGSPIFIKVGGTNNGVQLNSSGVLLPFNSGHIQADEAVLVNGVYVSAPNFNATTPAAPGGNTNVTWQVSGSNVSGYVPAGGGGTPGGTNGDLQYNNSGAFGGSAATISAAGTITIPENQSITDAAGNLIQFAATGLTLFDSAFDGIGFSPSSSSIYVAAGVGGRFTTNTLSLLGAAAVIVQGGVHFLQVASSGSIILDASPSLSSNSTQVATTAFVQGQGYGTGTVTSFSSGNLSPLFTTSVATATTTPALSFSLSNAAGGTVFGNATGSSGAPSYTSTPVLGVTGTGGVLGTLGLVPNITSGAAVTVQNLGATTAYNFNLPSTAGAAGSVLTSQAGTSTSMTWTTQASLGVAWSSLTNASGNLTLSNGTNTTTFDQTSNAVWTWANTTASTSGATQASPSINLSGTYWNGTASATDNWSLYQLAAVGTNGVSNLVVSHSGSSGNSYFALSNGITGFLMQQGAGNAIDFGANTSWTLNFTNNNGTTTNGALVATATSFQLKSSPTNSTVTISSALTTGASAAGVRFNNSASFTATSAGTQVAVASTHTFSPASGAASFIGFNINPTILGTSSGSTTALVVNPAIAATNLTGTNLIASFQSGGTPEVTINYSGLFSTYGGVATVANGVPSELATVNSTGNVANIASTTLYAVPAAGAGMYRVVAYIVETTAATTSSVLPSVVIGWKDETGTTQSSTIVAGGSTGNTIGTFASGSFGVYSEASQNITYSTTGYTSVGGTSMAFSLRLRLEYMG